MTDIPELREFPSKYFEWKIPKFFELPMTCYYSLKSSLFSSYGVSKWTIEIYPNGTSVSSLGCACMYIRKEPSTDEQRVVFRVGIMKVDGSTLKSFEFNKLFNKSSFCCRVTLFERLELLSLKDTIAPDGTLTVFCIAAVVDGPTVPSATRVGTPSLLTETRQAASQTPPSVTTLKSASQTTSSDAIPNLSKDLKELYLSKRLTDVTVQVKSREFLAHRNILSSRSAVFASMFLRETEEKKSGRIEIPDCDPDSFEDFLLFLYTGKHDCVTSTNAVSLYGTSNKYDVQELKEECSRCMIHTLTVDTFCDVLHLASMYDESELLKATTDFFINNTINILMTPKWHSFLSEHPSLGNELFLKTFTK